jgi:hypothetical protein
MCILEHFTYSSYWGGLVSGMGVTLSTADTVVLAVVSGAGTVGAGPVAAGLATGVATASLCSDMMDTSKFNPNETPEKVKGCK